MTDVAGIVVAGGDAVRFGRPKGKQMAELAGRPVLARSVAAMRACARVGSMVVVCHPERIDEYAEVARAAAGDVPVTVVAGGSTRQASVSAGLDAVRGEASVVVIHDGARPLAPAASFDAVLAALDCRPDASGAVIGHPSTDTVKIVETGEVVRTPERERVWAVQTPQAFRIGALRAAHAAAAISGLEATDDAALVERAQGTVLVVEGPRWNIKVTTEEDLVCASALIAGGVAGA